MFLPSQASLTPIFWLDYEFYASLELCISLDHVKKESHVIAIEPFFKVIEFIEA